MTGQDVDPFLIQYYGGNLGEFDASDTLEQLFLLPTIVNNSYYCPVINDDLIKDLCYSCANNFKEHSVYSYSTGEIEDSKLDDTGTILNYTNNNAIGKYATFIGNLLSFKVTSDVSIKSILSFQSSAFSQISVSKSIGITSMQPPSNWPVILPLPDMTS